MYILFIYICNSGNAVYFNTLLQEKIIMNIMKNFYNLYNLVRDNCKLYFINFKLGIGEIVFISLLLISVTWTIVSAISMNKFEILTAVISYVVSGSLTFYVLDGFNFSNYKLLRFIQKVSIYLILILKYLLREALIFLLIIYIFYLI